MRLSFVANCLGKIGTGRGRSLGTAFCINIRANISNFSVAHIFLPSLRGDPVSRNLSCFFSFGSQEAGQGITVPVPVYILGLNLGPRVHRPSNKAAKMVGNPNVSLYLILSIS